MGQCQKLAPLWVNEVLHQTWTLGSKGDVFKQVKGDSGGFRLSLVFLVEILAHFQMFFFVCHSDICC